MGAAVEAAAAVAVACSTVSTQQVLSMLVTTCDWQSYGQHSWESSRPTTVHV